MVSMFDIIADIVFFLMTFVILIYVLISLFSIKNGVDSKIVVLSSPIIYLGFFIVMLFGLIKFYQYSRGFKKNKKSKGEYKWLKRF
ncbi:hypothetical protein KY342_02455 [Candidatus Woesearchaeota archaeon]|nr:hypothetical protein [Candidatus Woesearchaeota archaeon]